MQIGAGSEGLRIPLEAVTRAFGCVGQRGTGKSTAIVALVEGRAELRASQEFFAPA